MFVSTVARLALRNLVRHPWRSAATVLGIGLGIAAVLTTLSVGDNVQANLRSAMQAASGKADLLLTPGAGGRAIFEAEPLLSQVRAVPGVVDAEPVLLTRAEPLREVADFQRSVVPGIDSGFQLQGRNTDAVEVLPARIAEGSLPAAGSMGIAIADGFARSRGIAVGDTVGFATSGGDAELRVTGLLDDAVGVASTNGGRIGIMQIDDLAAVLKLAGRVSHIEIQAASAAEVEPLRLALAELAGEGYAVTYPSTSGDFASGIVQTLQSGLSVLAATLLALGAFLAYNTFMASVVERRHEYALLRTICMTRGGVMRLALYEALFLALAGIVAGILLGIGLSYVVTALNAAALGFELRTLAFPLDNLLVASVLGVAAALLAGVLPARSAARVPPMAAIQSVEEPAPAWHVALGLGLLAIGSVMALSPWPGNFALVASSLSLGLFFAGVSLASPALLRPTMRVLRPLLVRAFGAVGKLGASFAVRNAARNGVAIGTVVVGTGLVIGVGSMVSSTNRAISDWVDTTVVGDLYVTSPVSFPADFGERASRVAGVAEASGVGIRVVRFATADEPRGRSVALVLVDPARFDPTTGFGAFQYIQGEGDALAGYQALLRGDEVLVANTMLDRYDIGTGDVISLRTVDGFQEFRVAGVIVDFTGGGETVVASIAQMGAFGGGSPDLFVLTIQPGETQETVRERLLAAFPELHLDVTLNADYRRYIMGVTSQAFSTTRVLLLIAVLVAALGVSNTLGMNLVARGHEIAVLRTLGLTRGGVRRLIAAEGIVVTLIGAVLGAGFGLLLARIVTTGAGALTGFALEVVVPWTLALLALLTSPVVGLIASVLPARRAARLAPTRALASWSEHA